MNEFELISRYFGRAPGKGLIGVGDDCAYVPQFSGTLAVSKDLLIEGRHFFSEVDPSRLGHKALAVNLSDLAAAGAEPIAAFLGLAMPRVDEGWLSGFSRGFQDLAERSNCPLLGGDTTRSSSDITISVTVLGRLNDSDTLPLRSAAKPGDHIWVSGSLGGAAYALMLLNTRREQGLSQADEQTLQACIDVLEVPEPQLRLGRLLCGHVHAMIDISDGLLGDLMHISQASNVSAVIHEDSLPAHPALSELTVAVRRRCLLAGGDDYQLCFTASPDVDGYITELSNNLQIPVSCIGYIDGQGSGISVLDSQGQEIADLPQGFDHFRK